MNAMGRSGSICTTLARLDKTRISSKFRSSAATTADSYPRGGIDSYDHPSKAMSASTELDNRRGAFGKKRAGSDCT